MTNILGLEERIKKLEEMQKETTTINKNRSQNGQVKYITIVCNIVAELFGGVIAAFILNNIYIHFFGKNTLVFALLLIFCSIAGLYNVIKIFLRNKQ